MEEQAPLTPTISFSDVIANVFSSPGEAFEGLRTSPSRGSTWIVPLIILFVLSSVFTWMIFTNDAIRNQIMDAQKTRLEEQVSSGKITQERADQALTGMEKAGGMMIAFGIVGGVIMITLMFFGAGLVFWLVGKLALKASGGYGKYLELWGATQWIGILGFIVTMLLVMAYSSIYATPSAALAVLGNYNPTDTTHRLLSSLNIFTFWQMIVVGIGLSKYAGKPSGTGIGISMVLWVLWIAISVFALSSLGM